MSNLQLRTEMDERCVAYTTPRLDVFSLVPDTAIKILDVGCSSGELGASLRAAVPGRQVIGIENDPEFCERARARLDDVVNADLNSFPWETAFPEDHFDCLIFSDVLEHLVDPWSCLRSACSRLRRDGFVVVSLPNIRHVTALYSIFLRGTFPRRPRGIFDRTHIRWFTLADARRMVTDAGLTIERYDFSLRVRDRGDGLLNRVARKLLQPLDGVYAVREFLSYQFCLLARKSISY